MSILELFCSVDDFWQQFAPTWHTSLLEVGQRQRERPTQMYQSRDDDHCDPVPPVALSDVQGLLYAVCAASLAQRVSHAGSLSALRRIDAHAAGSSGRLFAHPIGPLHRHQLYRLHSPGCLP